MRSYLTRFCAVHNHLMRRKNLFRANVLHNRRLHVQLELVAYVGFGEIELLVQRIQRNFLIEVLVDIIDERRDDSRRLLLNGGRGVVQLDQELNGLAQIRGVQLVVIVRLTQIVEVLEYVEIECGATQKTRGNFPFLFDVVGNVFVREFQDVAFVNGVAVDGGKMIFTGGNKNDIPRLELPRFRLDGVYDVTGDE